VYRVPESLRNKLKAPIGELIPDILVTKDLLSSRVFSSAIKEKRITVSIGDRTTERLIEFGFSANLEIIDGIERRMPRPSPVGFKGERQRELRVENPAGSISRNALLALDKCLKLVEEDMSQSVRLVVDGEEDLLTLPVVAFFPDKTTALYGQPNEGLVIVEANRVSRSYCRKILSEIGIKSLE